MFTQIDWGVACERLGWVLFHSLWQFLLVTLVVAWARVVLGAGSPARRHGIGVIGLMALATTPIFTLVWLTDDRRPESIALVPVDIEARQHDVGAREAGASHWEAVSVVGAEPAPPRTLPIEGGSESWSVPTRSKRSEWERWTAIARSKWLATRERVRPALAWSVWGWIVGVGLFSFRPLLSWWQVRRWRRQGLRAPDEALGALVEQLRRGLGIAHEVTVMVSERTELPMVMGWLRPLILLPWTMTTGLGEADLRAILAHELAHVKRHDYVVNFVQVWLETLFFYHPAVWWLSRRVRWDRELACDDLAIAVLGDRAGYGRALLAVEQWRGEPPLLSLSAGGGSLLARVRRICGRDESPPHWLLGSSLLALVVVVSGALSLVPRPELAAEDKSPARQTPVAEQATQRDWTPAALADEVAGAMARYRNAEYAATYTETRNAQFLSDKPPLLLSGDGAIRYRGDGRRWRVEERGFTLQFGESPHLIPTQQASGFDGDEFFIVEDDKLVLGENSQALQRWEPAAVFWRAGRSARWLQTALRSVATQVPRSEVIGGHECLVIVAQFGGKGAEQEAAATPEWRMEIALAPQRSFLPLRSILYRHGKLFSEEKLTALKQSSAGDWYPQRIASRQYGAGEFMVSRDLSVTEFRREPTIPTAKRDVPVGFDVVDYRLDLVWHQDPWWEELRPWLLEEMQWPKRGVSVSSPPRSFADRSREGTPAPPINPAEWIQPENPAEVPPPSPVTLLVFFGGDAIQPTPTWIASARTLHEKYRPHGLRVLGIAAATSTRETVVNTVKALAIPFPVALDAASGDGLDQSSGRTFADYGLKSYMGVVLIDREGKIRLLDDEDVAQPRSLETRIRELLAGELPPESTRDSQLSGEEVGRLRAEWKRRVQAESGKSRLTGSVTREGSVSRDRRAAVSSARIELMPVLRLLNSSLPGSWMLLPDYERVQRVETNAAGEFVVENLRRGSYQLSCSATGLARIQQTIHLRDDGDSLRVDLALPQEDSIVGQVVDSANQPVAGAKLKAVKRHTDPGVPWRHTTEHLPTEDVTSDPMGHFAWRNLFHGSYTLQVTAEGYEPQEVAAVPAGTKELRVVLQRPGEAARGGQARTTADKPHLRKDPAFLTRQLRIWMRQEKWSEIHALFATELKQELSATQLAEDWRAILATGGVFHDFKLSRLHETDPHWFEEEVRLEHQRVSLRLLWNDSAELIGWEWRTKPDEPVSYGPELRRRRDDQGSIEVAWGDSNLELSQDAGRNAQIELWREVPAGTSGDGLWRAGDGTVWSRCRLAVSDESRRFERLAPGRYRVAAKERARLGGRSGHSATVELAANGTAIAAMEFAPDAKVRLRLVRESDRSEMSDARVVLVRADGDWPFSEFSLVREAELSAVWQVDHVPAGKYRVMATHRARRPEEEVFETSPEHELLTVTAASQDLAVDVPLRGRPQTETEVNQTWPWIVRGTVRGQDGSPLPGVRLRASAGMGSLRPTGATETDQQGGYELRFGPGILFAHDEPDEYDAQIAVIHADLAGHAEVNLWRQGSFLAVNRLPRPGEQTFGEEWNSQLLIAGQPRQLNFVLVPAATVAAKFRDEKGLPLVGYDVDLDGDELPPASSVLGSHDTNERGEVEFGEVPVGFAWWLSASSKEHKAYDRGSRFRLSQPGRYDLVFRRRVDGESQLHWLEIESLTDESGGDVLSKSLVQDTGVGPLLPAAEQEAARELLDRVWKANGVWLRGPLPNIRSYSYRFQRPGKPSQQLVVDPRDTSQWPSIRGTAYRPGVATLSQEPRNLVFRRFELRDGVAMLGYVVKPNLAAVQLVHGLGVAGSYGPYVSYSTREGTLAIEVKTATPVWHQAGARREEFAGYVAAADGSWVPTQLRIFEHERLLHDWKFSLVHSGIWLLAEARDRDGKVAVRVDDVHVTE